MDILSFFKITIKYYLILFSWTIYIHIIYTREFNNELSNLDTGKSFTWEIWILSICLAWDKISSECPKSYYLHHILDFFCSYIYMCFVTFMQYLKCEFELYLNLQILFWLLLWCKINSWKCVRLHFCIFSKVDVKSLQTFSMAERIALQTA